MVREREVPPKEAGQLIYATRGDAHLTKP